MTLSTASISSEQKNAQLPINLVPYRLSINELERLFSTDRANGLTSSKAKDLLVKYGANNLGEGASISLVGIFIHQACNAMVMVLIISMVISLAMKDWISGGVIAFVVFVNIFVGCIQEYNAEKTMSSLKSLSSPTARVIRDGEDQTIPAEEVVPGDVCIVQVGDTIPADLRLFDCMNLETDEALLTGESLPIAKMHKEVYNEEIPVGDRLNMAYSSSTVSKGRGTGIVVCTGLQTEIGAIALSLQEKTSHVRSVEVDEHGNKSGYSRAIFGTIKDVVGAFLGTSTGTPLLRKLSVLACGLFCIAVVFAIVVMAAQKFHVTSEVGIYAICVALSMIPSSLVVVLTITMAVGAKIMASRNVIVRKLDSLEALGAVNDICSDKTGTLTQGKMIARSVWIPTVGTYTVHESNEPFNPTVGSIKFIDAAPAEVMNSENDTITFTAVPTPNPPHFQQWLETATLANIATVFTSLDEDGQETWKAHGDPTEIAIQVFTTRMDFPRLKLTEGDDSQFTHLAEFPFDSSIKRMTAVYKGLDETTVFTKGAVERVLECCDTWYGNSGSNETPQKLTDDDKAFIEENMNALSSEGLRVLAFSRRATTPAEASMNWAGKVDRADVEKNLTFLGLVGIYDPPRRETAGAVKQCHKAGINVHMLTGDHPGTAKAIAQEVGILPRNLHNYADDVVKIMVMAAPDFDKLSDAEVDALPVLPLVIARCAPQTKVRMIDALHRRKKFCAMTGDGVNDSPSLKKADIGIAMGITGSDVAKDASDIVLSDDNFASILNAIEEGRRMAANIQKFVLQLLAENVAQALYLMIGLVFMDEDGYSVFPLSPVEVLWIIVITSCFPAMGLGKEAAADNVLEVPPTSSIFSWEVIIDMFAYGTWMAACCLCTFIIIVYGKGDGNLGISCNSTSGEFCDTVFKARSGSFATMTWCALVLAWECIDMRLSLFKMHPESETPYTQFFKDVWKNQFLFWSVIGGFVSVFPVVYIPVINDKVFLHAPISWEWGLAMAFTVLFWAGAEFYKWMKRIFFRKRAYLDAVNNPEKDLERKSPFETYKSFSRSNTMNV
ncbi:hypothetical protein BABINDRAFT_170455 [Babjeviella inositovora NRRL Y-12698]|uniref:P-type Na(+) transporter n=1 Tax=Babjeviella inositovora NRRL Y-12698 TaxID=984486 RepID=A0A1E3QVY6_9ASCO|nr:uncharacterized protein BABINDRAFT_170455 [Babjeviella inositovora NRRL Y-12698]ODQ81818.1 hypothetical protein BABINDRAFT_170455 [Babjeviella inositovora NRRL Y-12698]